MQNCREPRKISAAGRDQSTPAVFLRSLIDSNIAAADYCCEPKLTRAEEYLLRLNEILEESPEIQITLSDLAHILSLERTYCCKIFRKITGQSFSDWLRKLRIRKAQYLLRLPGYSIRDVSRAVGYGDITTFERNFRRELGESPTSYRESSGIPSAKLSSEPA